MFALTLIVAMLMGYGALEWSTILPDDRAASAQAWIDDDRLCLLYAGGAESANVCSISWQFSNGKNETLSGAQQEPGAEFVYESPPGATAESTHVLVTACFRNGTDRVILDTVV
ncbi:hypothetical protein CUJ86_07570 [Methanofollis fontis]|uniref:Uncharacterized protein n=1 Tax=Methanofollis fontis TaxID=2052832 RepID=A0A483CRZ5_9EURY|nr:hypothetical protein CUJ86_07570 [Methanofollis fontis]